MWTYTVCIVVTTSNALNALVVKIKNVFNQLLSESVRAKFSVS